MGTDPPAPGGAARPSKVALVHDWLTGFRGGEQVLLSLARMFPDAEIHTLLHARGSLPAELERRTIRTTFIGSLPFARRLYRHYLPLFPLAASTWNVRDCDLVISSSHCVAKSVRVRQGALHVCYCHTPMRYVWDRFDDYFGRERLGVLGTAAARVMAEGLRAWDVATADRPGRYAANSHAVAGRIRTFYGRDATVIEPPVDTDALTPGSEAGDDAFAGADGAYELVVSALVPYKRIDLAIAAALATGRALKVVGNGPEEDRLRALAQGSPLVEFLGPCGRERLAELYRGARALVLPGVEDFGIVVAESLACGRPAVVSARGGAPEIIGRGEFGETVEEPDAGALAAAYRRLDTRRFSRLALRERARTFDRARFEARMREFVEARR